MNVPPKVFLHIYNQMPHFFWHMCSVCSNFASFVLCVDTNPYMDFWQPVRPHCGIFRQSQHYSPLRIVNDDDGRIIGFISIYIYTIEWCRVICAKRVMANMLSFDPHSHIHFFIGENGREGGKRMSYRSQAFGRNEMNFRIGIPILVEICFGGGGIIVFLFSQVVLFLHQHPPPSAPHYLGWTFAKCAAVRGC